MNESEETSLFELFSKTISGIFPLTACTYSIGKFLMFGHDQVEQGAQNCDLL